MLLKLVQCILATNWGTLPGKSHQWGINKQLTHKMTQLEHTVAVGFSDTLEKKNSLMMNSIGVWVQTHMGLAR